MPKLSQHTTTGNAQLHRSPEDTSDRVAFGFVKLLRFVADRFFAERYGHRAVVLVVRADEAGHRRHRIM